MGGTEIPRPKWRKGMGQSLSQCTYYLRPKKLKVNELNAYKIYKIYILHEIINFSTCAHTNFSNRQQLLQMIIVPVKENK